MTCLGVESLPYYTLYQNIMLPIARLSVASPRRLPRPSVAKVTPASLGADPLGGEWQRASDQSRTRKAHTYEGELVRADDAVAAYLIAAGEQSEQLLGQVISLYA